MSQVDASGHLPLPPGTSGIRRRRLLVNGRSIHFADTENAQDPLVLFLHGWPASWYLWRRQLSECAAHGWRGVAPDMRGFGSTEGSEALMEYNVYCVASDILGLMHLLGYERCVIVGHDYGAILTWQMALLYPKAFVAVTILSVPHGGPLSGPVLSRFKDHFGDPTDKENAKFFYMLHHQLPEAAAGYDANAREALYRTYGMPDGKSAPFDPPEVTDQKMWIEGSPVGMWRRSPRPKALPEWFPKEEFDYAVQEYESSGFADTLKWYQKFDIDWSITKHLKDRLVSQPLLFIAGTSDHVILMSGGWRKVEEKLPKVCASPPRLIFYRGAGHWLQLAETERLNRDVFAFLAEHRERAPLPLMQSRL